MLTTILSTIKSKEILRGLWKETKIAENQNMPKTQKYAKLPNF